MKENYGEKIKTYRLHMGLSQVDVAQALEVTPGYISNVENGRTAMSLRILIYYAKLMGTSLDSLVGDLEPDYQEHAVSNELLREISELSPDEQKKLLKTIRLWKSKA